MSPRLSARCLVLTAPPFFHANFCCSPLSCPVSTPSPRSSSHQLSVSCSTTNCLLLLASLLSSHQLPLSGSRRQLSVSCPTTNSSLGSSHQLSSLLSNYQLSFSGPATNSPWSPVQLPTLLSCHQLPLCSPATNSLSPVQLPTASLGLQPQLALSLLPPTLSWVALSTLIRLPVPLPGTARFHVQESFVWFRAKTDSSALAAYPHSATFLSLGDLDLSSTEL